MGTEPGSAAARAGASGKYVPDPRRWKALTVCLIVGFMALLDVSIVNVALPAIEKGLGASESALSWVVSGYALTFGLVLVPSGRLGDALGRRTAFFAGLVLFTVASVVCGLAQDPSWLVIARLVQGIGGGLLMPQISGMIQQLFRGAERGKAFGLLGSTIGISTAVGPLLGGLLIQAFGAAEGWRWVFFVNLPIGVLAFCLGLRLVPAACAERDSSRRESFDPFGVLLLGAGVIAIMLPLVEERQWQGPGKWLLEPVGVLLIFAFLRWERSYLRAGREPLVDLRLFADRSYSLGALLGLLYFAGFTTIFFVFTLFLQNGMRYSALQAGLSLTPFAVGSAVSAAVGGRFVIRVGRPLIAAGLVLVAIGLGGAGLAVHEVQNHSVGWAMAPPMLVAGLGSGLVISPNQTLALQSVPVAQGGAAGGVLQTGQRIGSAAGVAAVGAVFFAWLASSHDWATALDYGLLAALCFVVAALVVALFDVMYGRREARREGQERGEGARGAETRPEGQEQGKGADGASAAGPAG
ncbi:MFS transporter [Streptomyces sp. NBC_01795]|uniref:MFS transporter n=1 Tax=unclassified Streptomyces TaxID=2593676 RepID=UPI002DDB6361|nr:MULTISPECIES: MFS transporter [unclassified Streptomyces]WSA95129.1 MFS transporter [Streptomyces sp. NBC_01795]WSS12246.1 MFS transporter [Streptomyces sp. NBC_01186]